MTSFALTLVAFVAYFINPVASLNTTRYEVGPGDRMRDYQYVDITAAAPCTGSGTQPSCAHKPSTSNKWIGSLKILADATGTGSATVKTAGYDGTDGTKYPAICTPNPFRKMGTGTGRTFFNTGTGTVTLAIYQNVRNPNAAAGDLGYVKGCLSGTGAQLINNTCTATGCTNIFALGNHPSSTCTGTGCYAIGLSQTNAAANAAFNDKDYIKLGMSKDPTPSFRAQIYLEVLGIGEKF